MYKIEILREEEIKTEKEQNKKLIEIMNKYKYEDYDKIVIYNLYIGIDKSTHREETDLYHRAENLLKEMKFFDIGIYNKYEEIFITGTPGFAKEICEFFADYEGLSEDAIGEPVEITLEEKEAVKKSKIEDLLSKLEDFKNESKAVFEVRNYPRDKQLTNIYTGRIFLKIDKERAFVDLEENIFEKIIKILDETDELYKAYTEQNNIINIMIEVEYTRCITLFDLLVKAFGRGNMMECEMTIK